MWTKTCKICGAEIAKSASYCPYCGAKQWDRVLLSVLSVLLLITGSLYLWLTMVERRFEERPSSGIGSTEQKTSQASPVYEDEFISITFQGCERHRYFGVDKDGTYSEYKNGIVLRVENKTAARISVSDKEVTIISTEQGEYTSSGYSILNYPPNDWYEWFYEVPEMTDLEPESIRMKLWVAEYSENYEIFGDYFVEFEVSPKNS